MSRRIGHPGELQASGDTTILPMCPPCSILRCAAAVSSSGNTESTIGRGKLPTFGVDALRYAMLVIAGVYVVSATAAYLASRFFVADLARLQGE